jgi:predicted LPLAT superfamily acyltransferase
MAPPSPETPPAADVWCVVPAYNNAATVAGVVRGCRERIPNVLVVDDGSTDADLAGLVSGLDVHVVRHARNRGKGCALLTGLAFVAARGARHMITIDADGQHDPADLPVLVRAVRETPDAIVVGCRDFSGPNVPGSSRFGRRFSNFWIRLETGRSVADSQSGFRAYPVAPLSRLRFSGRRYDFEVEVLVRASWAGVGLRDVPVRVHYPPRGHRVSHFRPWMDNLLISRTHARLVGRRLVPIPHRQVVDPAPTPGGAEPGAAATDPDRRIETRRRGNRLGFWFFRIATRLTGLRGAYGLLYLVCPYYALFDRAAIAAASAYLGRRFPGLRGMRLRGAVLRLFLHQGRGLVDRHASQAGAFRFEIDASELDRIAPLLSDPGRGFVLLLAHAGNWQIALPSLQALGRKVCLLMRKEDNPAVRDSLRIDDEGGAFDIVSPERFLGGVVDLVDRLRRGQIVSIMGDRSYGFSPVPVRFIGGTAAFPGGPYSLAAAAECPIVTLFCTRTSLRHYRIEVPLVFAPADLPAGTRRQRLLASAQKFADEVGRYAREHPYECFLFHDVWKDAATLLPPATRSD